MLTAEEIHEINEEIGMYPYRQAACIEALKVVQKYRRWVSDESIEDIAAHLEMSAAEVDSVATFYNLIYRKPVGKYVILVCDSVSCYIMGAETMLDHLQNKLGIGLGQTTADDRFTLLTVPCLGTCDHAPAMMVGRDLHRDLTPGKIDAILAACP
ncbi:MAG TPA: NADH-quinone oxidoreductase subunit NuoE [Bacteroidales bacterium]|nr:NADH-quinone oxidoreductase subunit NuoE [Bacteroidales bacterium]HRZ48725.1 NADH-quinone oxidoreductase subunit NuoE [Bacteroidales bacterium]